MGLLFDALQHLLATDPVRRRAGLSGMVGSLWRVAPVVVGHPSMPADIGFGVFNYPTPADGSRCVAVRVTIGLAETQGRELIALTLANVRDPAADRFAWLLSEASRVARDEIAPLPEGCLGRSSHTFVTCTDPWPITALRGEELAKLMGARIDLVLPITAREAIYARARGVTSLTESMRAQSIDPWSDRLAGQTALSDANLAPEGEP